MPSRPLFPISGPVAVAGSRVAMASPALCRLARRLAGLGVPLAVGCCVGVDSAMIRVWVLAGAAPRVSVLAAFGPGGRGAGRFSAVRSVVAAAAAGASVSWWAGGRGSVPLARRLAVRRSRLVGSASVLVVWAASPPSCRSGSLAAARCALRLGRRLVVVGPARRAFRRALVPTPNPRIVG